MFRNVKLFDLWPIALPLYGPNVGKAYTVGRPVRWIVRMLPLLVLAGIFLAAGIFVGRFRPPRPIDTRMTVGAFLMFAGVAFLVQALMHLH